MAAQTPKPKRRRERGDDGISWDKANKCYVGTSSLGYDDTGKRLRRFVRGKTKQEVKGKLDDLHDEIKAGIHTPGTYTVKQCVMDWQTREWTSTRTIQNDSGGYLRGHTKSRVTLRDE